jgi:hypothetical protein
MITQLSSSIQNLVRIIENPIGAPSYQARREEAPKRKRRGTTTEVGLPLVFTL